MISAKTDQGRSVTRNSSFFKRLHGRDETEVGADEDPLLDECTEPKPRDDLVANDDSTTKNDNSPVQLTPSPDLPILRVLEKHLTCLICSLSFAITKNINML